jgi:hypothetical protein
MSKFKSKPRYGMTNRQHELLMTFAAGLVMLEVNDGFDEDNESFKCLADCLQDMEDDFKLNSEPPK